MGKFAAIPNIAKNFERNMMSYYERFVKEDSNVDKGATNE